MDIGSIKEGVFRHCEKVALLVALVFVGYYIYSAGGGDGGNGGSGLRPGAKPPEVAEGIGDSFRQSARPFVRVPDATGAVHNWFYPPGVEMLPAVQLRMGAGDESKARRKVGAKIVGQPVSVKLTEPELGSLPEPPSENPTAPCQVTVTVDPSAPDTLLFEATKAGFWAGYEATLENEDKVRVHVLVLEKELIIKKELPLATIDQVTEEPLGTVLIRFSVPEAPKQGPESRTRINYIEPDHFVVWRKGERETERKAIGRIEGRKAAAAAPGTKPKPDAGGGTRHGGFPGGFPGSAKPKTPPGKPKPGGQAAEPEEPGKYVFRDSAVESESSYTYWVETVGPEDAEGKTPRAESTPKIYTTAAKFSFAYTGGGSIRANILVFIGPRNDYQDVKKFVVQIGERIGTLPQELRKEGGAEGEGAGAAAAEGEDAEKAQEDTRYVTRFVLVDIVQRKFRLVEQIQRVPDGKELDGRIKFKQVVTYRGDYANQVILRDRQNRLIRLWLEIESKALKAAGK